MSRRIRVSSGAYTLDSAGLPNTRPGVELRGTARRITTLRADRGHSFPPLGPNAVVTFGWPPSAGYHVIRGRVLAATRRRLVIEETL